MPYLRKGFLSRYYDQCAKFHILENYLPYGSYLDQNQQAWIKGCGIKMGSQDHRNVAVGRNEILIVAQNINGLII